MFHTEIHHNPCQVVNLAAVESSGLQIANWIVQIELTDTDTCDLINCCHENIWINRQILNHVTNIE